MLTPSIGILLDAVDTNRFGHADALQDGRGHVDEVMELPTEAAVVLDACRPRDHHRRGRPPPEVTSLPYVNGVEVAYAHAWIGAVRPRAAEVVEALGEVVERLRDAVPVAQLVHGAVQAPLGGRAVVAGDVDDERVVEFAGLIDGFDDAAHLVIRVLDRAAEDLHPASADALVRVRQLVPRRNPVWPGLELRVVRHDPELLLAGQDPIAEHVIAVVETASILIDPLAGTPTGGLCALGA